MELLAIKPEIGPYRIVCRIGAGGMGEVYLAEDTRLRRKVALKTFTRAVIGGADARKRLLREARAIAALNHPNIAAIYDIIDTEERTHIVMEYVPGETLAARIAGGPLIPEEVIKVGIQLSEALATAHARGVIHRDLKPSNLLLTPEGTVKILDFGLARIERVHSLGSDSMLSSDLTPEGRLVGTPPYLPPEHILGSGLDARSDIYSLGVVLFEALTGRRPFEGKDPHSLAKAIVSGPTPSVRDLNPAVPADLDALVSRTMAKDPQHRHASASQVAEELRQLAVSGTRPTLSADFQSPWMPWGFRALSTALVVIGVVAAGVIVVRRSLASPLPSSTPHQVTSARGWEAEPALSPDGSLIAYTSDEAGQPDIWLLDSHEGSTLRLTNDPAVEGSPSWFPDGTALAFVSNRGGRSSVWKVPRLGGSPILLVANAADPAVSPNGRHIAFTRQGPRGSRIFEAALGDHESIRRLTSDADGLWSHRHPAWSPDGESLCYSAQQDLWIVASGGGPARRLTRDDEVDTECVWSPSGRYVYFSSYRGGTLAIWRVPSKGGPAERVTQGGSEAHPSLSRDGRRLAYSTFLRNPDIVLRDMTTGEEQRIGGLRDEISAAFCPDQRAVVFDSNRLGGRSNLWLQPIGPTGALGAERRLTDHTGSVSHPACSPDGHWVAYYRILAGQRDVWVAPTDGGFAEQFTSDAAADIHPDWSPDGSRIAFVSERGGGSHIWIEPVADGRPAGAARQLTFGTLAALAPAWSPDRTAIAFIGAMEGEESDVWIVPAAGGAPRRVTHGASAQRVRWDRSSGLLIVSGQWDSPNLLLRRIQPDDGSEGEVLPRILLQPDYPDFDPSPDGKWLVFTREERRGDVWVLDAQEGSY